MTNSQYEILVKLLTEKVEEQQTTIYLKDYEIDELKRKLSEAEAQIPAPAANN